MTPAGHAAISYLAAKAVKKLSPIWTVSGGILPDLDFLLFPFGFFNSIHRVLTHNLLFGIVSPLLIIAFVKNKSLRLTIYLSVLTGILLHLMIDSVMDNNPSNGLGIAIFYPFSGLMFHPFNLLTSSVVKKGWDEPFSMIRTAFPGFLIELPVIFTACFVYLSKKKFKNKF